MVDLEPMGGDTVRCRYCGQLNNVRGEAGQAKCGRCRLTLSGEPHKKFANLDKYSYIHPLDSRALAALRNIPGIDTALKKLLEVTGESAIRVIFTASAVKVTPKQCPDLYAKLQIACTTLGVDMPELFVQQNPIGQRLHRRRQETRHRPPLAAHRAPERRGDAGRHRARGRAHPRRARPLHHRRAAHRGADQRRRRRRSHRLAGCAAHLGHDALGAARLGTPRRVVM